MKTKLQQFELHDVRDVLKCCQICQKQYNKLLNQEHQCKRCKYSCCDGCCKGRQVVIDYDDKVHKVCIYCEQDIKEVKDYVDKEKLVFGQVSQFTQQWLDQLQLNKKEDSQENLKKQYLDIKIESQKKNKDSLPEGYIFWQKIKSVALESVYPSLNFSLKEFIVYCLKKTSRENSLQLVGQILDLFLMQSTNFGFCPELMLITIYLLCFNDEVNTFFILRRLVYIFPQTLIPSFIIENGFNFLKLKNEMEWKPEQVYKDQSEGDHILVQGFLENKIQDIGSSWGLNFFNFKLSELLFTEMIKAQNFDQFLQYIYIAIYESLDILKKNSNNDRQAKQDIIRKLSYQKFYKKYQELKSKGLLRLPKKRNPSIIDPSKSHIGINPKKEKEREEQVQNFIEEINNKLLQQIKNQNLTIQELQDQNLDLKGKIIFLQEKIREQDRILISDEQNTLNSLIKQNIIQNKTIEQKDIIIQQLLDHINLQQIQTKQDIDPEISKQQKIDNTQDILPKLQIQDLIPVDSLKEQYQQSQEELKNLEQNFQNKEATFRSIINQLEENNKEISQKNLTQNKTILSLQEEIKKIQNSYKILQQQAMQDIINLKINYQYPIASNNIDIFKMGNPELHFNSNQNNKDNEQNDPQTMYSNIVQENHYQNQVINYLKTDNLIKRQFILYQQEQANKSKNQSLLQQNYSPFQEINNKSFLNDTSFNINQTIN